MSIFSQNPLLSLVDMFTSDKSVHQEIIFLILHLGIRCFISVRWVKFRRVGQMGGPFASFPSNDDVFQRETLVSIWRWRNSTTGLTTSLLHFTSSTSCEVVVVISFSLSFSISLSLSLSLFCLVFVCLFVCEGEWFFKSWRIWRISTAIRTS
jgi:hypothetical protein